MFDRKGDGPRSIMGNERGIALVLTMFIMVFLTVIVIEGFTTAYVDLSIAGNFRDGIKAGYIARAGIDAARGILAEDNRSGDSKKYDSLTEPWAMLKDNIFPFPVGDGAVRVEIYDEGGKINLNNLVNCPPTTGSPVCSKNEDWVELLKRFFIDNDMEPDIADALVDWLDTNDDPEPAGAEKGYYLSLSPSYEPRNGRLITHRELLLVRGIDRKAYEKMLPFITVYGFINLGQVQNPEGRVNINTAPLEVLTALDEDFTEELARKVIEYRNTTPFRKIKSLETPTGLTYPFPFSNRLTVKSAYFTVLSTGSVNDVTRIEKVVVKRDGIKVKIGYWWPE